MQLSGKGAQTPLEDPRNAALLIWINGQLVPRRDAKVSIFDAGFGLGDGIWEGLRLVDGRLLFLDDHLDRLYAAAKAVAIDIGLPPPRLAQALRETVEANGMVDGAHLRLMVTRGEKTTIHQDPRNACGRATIVITAEYKIPDPDIKKQGLVLATSPIRCTAPDGFDMRLNSHSRINLIRALLPAIAAGADEALMLDPRGFVSSCNSTNFFIVRQGTIVTSGGLYCFNGITRGKVIDLCLAEGLSVRQMDFTLDEVYDADEAFVTGTFGGVTAVARVDGHPLGEAGNRPTVERIAALYDALIRKE